MLAWLASFLSGPIINGAINAYKAKLAAQNDHERLAADLAGRELAIQHDESKLQNERRKIQLGKWYTPENLFAYILVVYFGKCILFDKVVGSFFTGKSIFVTDPITGELLLWAGTIMLFLFGKRGIENIFRILGWGK